jgi:hypothetical protein
LFFDVLYLLSYARLMHRMAIAVKSLALAALGQETESVLGKAKAPSHTATFENFPVVQDAAGRV